MSSKLSRLYCHETAQCSSTGQTKSLFLRAPNNGNLPSCHSTIQYLKRTVIMFSVLPTLLQVGVR